MASTVALPALLIGEVAAQSGLPVKTIRYYADLGLIPTQGRTEGGFRIFAPEVLQRLAFIRRAQSLGMSLEEIGHVLAIRDQGSPPCEAIQELLLHKVAQIDRQIAELHLLKQQLLHLLQDWQIPAQVAEDQICPNLDDP
ncbi:MAG: heavy metal-responsive transcriptional regulator [Thermostichales cyanobacterium DRC_bins_46]